MRDGGPFPVGQASVWLAALLILASAHDGVSAAERDLLLDVIVNGYPLGKIGDFVQRDGAMLATRTELSDLGLRVPEALPLEPGDLVGLRSLEGIVWRVDEGRQALMITATDAALLPTLLTINAASASVAELESGTGAMMNYDVTATAGKRSGASGLLDLRAFSPRGTLNTGMLVYTGQGQSNPGAASTIRLDTTYTFSAVGTLRRYRLGDLITGSLAWTRPVRLGGAQLTSDFSMRPDLVTFPLPSIGGSAAVPSTIDLLVNGNRLLSREVGAGPFEIPQLPVVTGAGTVALTLTNALGRQIVTTLPFYASADLLAPGLQTFSAQAGAVRRRWGQLSHDYGAGAASGTWRRGWSPGLTVEGSAEATRRTFMSGVGAVANVADLAVINVAGSASTGSSDTGVPIRGTRWSTGVQRMDDRFSFGTSLTVASRKFRDIAAASGDPFPRTQFSASGGLSLGSAGSLGVSYTRIKRDELPANIAQAAGDSESGFTQNARLLSASYSTQFRGVSLYASTFRDFDRNGSSGISVGLTLPLGRRSSTSAGIGSNADYTYRQLQAQQSAVSVADWGYQVYATDGATARQFARIQYMAPWALTSAGIDHAANDTTLSLQSQGAVSMIDGSVFASNTINDSFAVVDTNGLSGVHVLHENRPAGITDASGRLLVTDLRGFEVNGLAVDPADIPADATLNVTAREVRLPGNSGVVLHFAVRLSRGALLRLSDAAGLPIPVGSTATLSATGITVPIGYDGQAYVQDLAEHNQLTVNRAEGNRCTVSFPYKPTPGNIPTIGPLVCRDPK